MPFRREYSTLCCRSEHSVVGARFCVTGGDSVADKKKVLTEEKIN